MFGTVTIDESFCKQLLENIATDLQAFYMSLQDLDFLVKLIKDNPLMENAYRPTLVVALAHSVSLGHSTERSITTFNSAYRYYLTVVLSRPLDNIYTYSVLFAKELRLRIHKLEILVDTRETTKQNLVD